jgi:hypothetical protein
MRPSIAGGTSLGANDRGYEGRHSQTQETLSLSARTIADTKGAVRRRGRSLFRRERPRIRRASFPNAGEFPLSARTTADMKGVIRERRRRSLFRRERPRIRRASLANAGNVPSRRVSDRGYEGRHSRTPETFPLSARTTADTKGVIRKRRRRSLFRRERPRIRRASFDAGDVPSFGANDRGYEGCHSAPETFPLWA